MRNSSRTPLTPPPMSAPVSGSSMPINDWLELGSSSQSMSNVFTSVDAWNSTSGNTMLNSTVTMLSQAPVEHAPLSPQSSIASSGSGGSDNGNNTFF